MTIDEAKERLAYLKARLSKAEDEEGNISDWDDYPIPMAVYDDIARKSFKIIEDLLGQGEDLGKRIEIGKLKNQIKNLQDVSNDNVAYLDFIEDQALRVKDKATGNIIDVNKNTVVGFNDNQEFIKFRILSLQTKLDWLLQDTKEQ